MIIQLIASHVNSLAPLHLYASSHSRPPCTATYTPSLGRAGPHGRARHFLPSLKET